MSSDAVTLEEPNVDDLCDLRTEARARIVATAAALVDRVLAHSIDGEARELAEQMRKLIDVERAATAAIRAQVG